MTSQTDKFIKDQLSVWPEVSARFRALKSAGERRLAAGGFVRVARISPNITLLDLDSWRDHLWRCLADPDYWERDGEAERRYRRANFSPVRARRTTGGSAAMTSDK